ncbi:MAG: FAD-dependent oxidoreductase, partial [Vampirovibrionales bacterium]|nr:FAD-dependent oxidoreductase [Vampirovibrionales bacterium]
MTTSPLEIAIVGSGIAGLSAAYRLHQALGDKVALTILEQHETLGGHTCTVDIQDASGRTLAID